MHRFQHSSSGLVKDLFEDLKDGVLLCHLIEVLTGEALVSPLQVFTKYFIFVPHQSIISRTLAGVE
ncbi:unnamed protein product [Gongylonema pulchrum]|uniref:Calponin-homology (CH) domain-containing protein n=1 Tax=Gongylonema pulchrum TaxID=637853 RepID=A0A183EXY4_9BILA|nr:unnamed protein product [Gongylonema pulchrum]